MSCRVKKKLRLQPSILTMQLPFNKTAICFWCISSKSPRTGLRIPGPRQNHNFSLGCHRKIILTAESKNQECAFIEIFPLYSEWIHWQRIHSLERFPFTHIFNSSSGFNLCPMSPFRRMKLVPSTLIVFIAHTTTIENAKRFHRKLWFSLFASVSHAQMTVVAFSKLLVWTGKTLRKR